RGRSPVAGHGPRRCGPRGLARLDRCGLRGRRGRRRRPPHAWRERPDPRFGAHPHPRRRRRRRARARRRRRGRPTREHRPRGRSARTDLPEPRRGAAMSTQTETPAPASAPRGTLRERSPWSLTWHGVETVARLELRQRVRSTKWYIGLAVFFVIVGIVTVLTMFTMSSSSIGDVPPELEGGAGRVVFDVVVFFILLLGILVAPTLSSSAINGDRKEGTLAILQVTLLTPAEIAVGKVLASWAAALAFL